MKTVKYGLALVAVLMVAACAKQGEQAQEDSAAALDTTEKRLSYGIAYGLGDRLKADGVPLDVDSFSMGLRHAYEGADQLLSDEEISQEMQNYQTEQNAKRMAAAEAAAEGNAAEGAAFLAENAKVEGVVVLDSGLQYQVLTEGEGAKPGPEDTVEVNYRGTLLDGTEFDSSYARNSSVSFALNQVIPGWTEGLQQMTAGSTYRLFIPPELAYGPGGAGDVIGPNATLIFDVELIAITPKETAAE